MELAHQPIPRHDSQMKLYNFGPAPNPRRVRMFAAEKDLALELVDVNLREGEQFSSGYRKINPEGTIPTLQLDDGTCLFDSVAICRYLDELRPEPNLFGTDSIERAQVEYWSRRADLEGMSAVAEGYRNHVPFFKDRALPGKRPVPQVAALAERGLQRTNDFLSLLDERLAESPFVAAERFTMADISMFVSVEMAGWMKLKPDDSRPALLRWHQTVSARPSASA